MSHHDGLTPQAWLANQQQLGRLACLVLDTQSANGSLAAIPRAQPPRDALNVYLTTPVAELADASPYLCQAEALPEATLQSLLDAPEHNWGWFAAIPVGQLEDFAQHWRQRLIFGERPRQALYRFQDNRVLARALAQLPASEVPSYLGLALEVCYWDNHGRQWRTQANPAPGPHPAPGRPAWLELPASAQQMDTVQKDNARRYLLAEHLDAFVALAGAQDPQQWLDSMLALAKAWGWASQEQVNFLLGQSLHRPGYQVPKRWSPQQGETPASHFERVQQDALTTQGNQFE